MEVVKSIKDMRALVGKARLEGKTVGFVPTMGYLHEGHLSLVKISREHTSYQVMSIFVNRIQFNDPKDFSNYPIDLERDFDLARRAGVDCVFVPDEGEMYNNRLTCVDVDLLTDNLCGAFRPGHFRGVFTVVSKLFNIIQPDVAVFGQKDIQQAVSIEKMVKDLDFPVRIIIAPIIREKDGLAMSSRNKHLTPEQRGRALCLIRSLKKAEEMILSGERQIENIHTEMESIIRQGGPDSIDYISAVRFSDLSFIERIYDTSAIAVAAFFGTTRLIDNMIIEINGGIATCRY